MFGNSSRINALESRKRLLIAESEINRAQLVGDLAALTAEIHTLAERAKSLGTVASSAAVLVAGLATFRRGKPVAPAAKPSWLQMVFKGASLVSTIWRAFRSRGRDHENEQSNSRG